MLCPAVDLCTHAQSLRKECLKRLKEIASTRGNGDEPVQARHCCGLAARWARA